MSADSASDPRIAQDREAIEQIVGHPLPQVRPTGALAPGTRARVIRDTDWNGPWATEFLGTIDTVGAPEPVQHPHARPGELRYWVKFDQPQFDHAHDGPYRGAQIWDRYLQPLTGHRTEQAPENPKG